MKKYRHIKDGTVIEEGQCITRRLRDGGVFSGIPTPHQLRSWGFEETEETNNEKI